MDKIYSDEFIFHVFKPNYKSKLIFSDCFGIMSEKKYNKFQKLMYKICFNIKVEDIEV